MEILKRYPNFLINCKILGIPIYRGVIYTKKSNCLLKKEVSLMGVIRPRFETGQTTAEMNSKVREQNDLIRKWAPVISADRSGAESLRARAVSARLPWTSGDRSGLGHENLLNAALYAARGNKVG
jgi:hypothetical protein